MSKRNAPQNFDPQQYQGQPGQYPQGQYPQGPGGQWQTPMPPAPPAPVKKKSWFARHKILTGIGVLAIIGVIGTAVNGGGDETATDVAPAAVEAAEGAPAAAEAPAEEGAAPAEAPAEEAAAGLNTPVTDGDIEFTVTGVETGVSEVGESGFGETAQGQYVLISVTATNVGTEPVFLTDSDQKVFDEQGREFSPDSGAAIYVDEANMWFEEINPGNTLEGVLIYDMPTDATPTEINLVGGFFSSGATVNLAS